MRRAIIAIGIFVLMLGGVLFAYQSPVNFVDTVRSVDLNVGFHKVTEWITDIGAKADSVHGFINDSLAANWDAFIANDTVTSYRVAIHDSLDANWAVLIADDTSTIFDAIHDTIYGNPDVMEHDTLFCGYNTSTKIIVADQEMFLELDGTTRNDGIYTVVQSDTVLDISTAGDYLVHYGASVDYDAGSGASFFRVQLMKYTSSWSAVTGSIVYQAIEANAAGHYMSVSKSWIVTMAAGNDLGVEFYVPVSLPTVEIIANTGFLTIEKKH